MQTYSFFGKQSPVGEKVLKALMAKYPDVKGPGDITPAVGVANAYDAMMLVALAIEQAGSTDGDAIRQGFYKIDGYDGLIKTYVEAVHRRQPRRGQRERLRLDAVHRQPDPAGRDEEVAPSRLESARADGRLGRPSCFAHHHMLITSALISGLGLGSMYGLLALGFYVTYSVSSTVNFAQGSSMMLGAVLAYTFAVRLGWPLWAAALLALALCALYGLVVELRRGPPVRAARLERLADGHRRARHRRRQRRALHLRQGAARLPDARVAHRRDGTIARHRRRRRCSSRFRSAGLAAGRRAASLLAPHAARQGAARGGAEPRRRAPDGDQRRRSRSSAAYAVSTVFAGVAGILIAPLFNVHSDMGTLFGLKAFAVAILGGITSAWGVMLAGLLFGVVEALITALARLRLHPDRHVRAGHRRARADAERAVRPGRGEEGMRPLAAPRGRRGRSAAALRVHAPSPTATTCSSWRRWR